VITATIRDIAIIVIAIQSIVIGALIAVLIYQIWQLIKMLQRDIKPILQDTQDTINTVRGTTEFVSKSVVDPVAKTTSYLFGARKAASVLTRDVKSALQPLSRSTKFPKRKKKKEE